MDEEIEVNCPFCNEPITLLIDLYISEQDFIEDCSVCCRPMQVHVSCEDHQLTNIEVGRSQ